MEILAYGRFELTSFFRNLMKLIITCTTVGHFPPEDRLYGLINYSMDGNFSPLKFCVMNFNLFVFRQFNEISIFPFVETISQYIWHFLNSLALILCGGKSWSFQLFESGRILLIGQIRCFIDAQQGNVLDRADFMKQRINMVVSYHRPVTFFFFQLYQVQNKTQTFEKNIKNLVWFALKTQDHARVDLEFSLPILLCILEILNYLLLIAQNKKKLYRNLNISIKWPLRANLNSSFQLLLDIYIFPFVYIINYLD